MARMTSRQLDRAFAEQPDEENALAFEPADDSCFDDEPEEMTNSEYWHERNMNWEPDSYHSDFNDDDFSDSYMD